MLRAACRAGSSRDDREGENEESLGGNSALAERPLSAGQEEKDDGGDGEEGVGIQRVMKVNIGLDLSHSS